MSNKSLKHFPRIREARELLLAKAEELIQMKLKIAKEALDNGRYEDADNAINWLLEHMPSHEGITVIEQSIDKPKPESKLPTAPSIQIGIALGGVPSQKQLPSTEVIDVKPDE